MKLVKYNDWVPEQPEQLKGRRGVGTVSAMSWLPTMMTFGGSPIAVAVPPMLLNITSAMRTCFGSIAITSHNLKQQNKDNSVSRNFKIISENSNDVAILVACKRHNQVYFR